jgi:hypothetical protein
MITANDLKNDPQIKAMYDRLDDREKAIIDKGIKNPKAMHLEAINIAFSIMGAETWLVTASVVATILGYDITHFKEPSEFIEYLDKALNEKELGRIATALLMITEAKRDEATRKFR